MAKETFIWYPNADDWSADEAPSNFVVKFGDGYEQRMSRGINGNPYKFKVSFSGNFAEMGVIRAFLRARDAVESFIWVNPFSESGFYVARKWSFSREVNGIYRISTEFEQVFD